MASNKYYAYYLRGNKIAVVQQDYAYGDGQTLNQPSLDDIGPSGAYQWKSPLQDITDGLELEYAYSPEYNFINGGDQEGTNRHWRPIGWTSTNGGRLAFILPEQDFATSPAPQVGEQILIQGSSRWNGVHVVHKNEWTGLLVTTTAVGSGVGDSSITLSSFAVNGTTKAITGYAASDSNQLMALFPEGTHYAFIGGTDAAADAANENSLYKVTSDGAGIITATAQYTLTNMVVTESTSPVLTTNAQDAFHICKVYYDPIYLYNDVSFNMLTDENDTLDVTEYQSKALVYYVKAKLAEDMMDIEAKEYFMKEFRKILEKHESGRVWGQRVVIPGGHAVR